MLVIQPYIHAYVKKAEKIGKIMGLVYNSPSSTSRVMTSLMASSIEFGGGRRSHTKFGDDVTTTS